MRAILKYTTFGFKVLPQTSWNFWDEKGRRMEGEGKGEKEREDEKEG